MNHELIAVRIFDQCHMADRRIPRLIKKELHSLFFQIFNSLFEILNLERYTRSFFARLEIVRATTDSKHMFVVRSKPLLNESRTVVFHPFRTNFETKFVFIKISSTFQVSHAVAHKGDFFCFHHRMKFILIIYILGTLECLPLKMIETMNNINGLPFYHIPKFEKYKAC